MLPVALIAPAVDKLPPVMLPVALTVALLATPVTTTLPPITLPVALRETPLMVAFEVMLPVMMLPEVIDVFAKKLFADIFPWARTLALVLILPVVFTWSESKLPVATIRPVILIPAVENIATLLTPATPTVMFALAPTTMLLVPLLICVG